MTKNGYFCGSVGVLLALASFVTAAISDKAPGWFGVWLGVVSMISLIGAAVAAYAAACDYLMENEE